MNLKEAMTIVNQVCTNYRGTLQEHQQIQSALQYINSKLKESENERHRIQDSEGSVS